MILSRQFIVDHLWQSTLFAAFVWLLNMTLRKNRAAVRHRLWLAASLKFLVPFSLLVGIGDQFAWRGAPAIGQQRMVSAVEEISQPFCPASVTPVAVSS